MAKEVGNVRYYGSRAVRPENLKASKSGLKAQLESLRVSERVQVDSVTIPRPASPEGSINSSGRRESKQGGINK